MLHTSKPTGLWTGAEDAAEEQAFQEVIARPFGFTELAQDVMTCNTGTARSRIDRVYSNHHAADQLDRAWAATALPWCASLSDHRPISFSRRLPARDLDRAAPLDPAILRTVE